MACRFLSMLLVVIASQAKHHHHHHRQHKEVDVPEQAQETNTILSDDYKFSPQEVQEMQAAEDDDNPFAPKPEYGMYDMRGDHFDILDTPEKMDPDYQAKQNLAAVNKANHLRGGSQDDDDDDDE